MKVLHINFWRLVLAAASGFAAYWMLAALIEGVTEISSPQLFINETAEALLFLISPLAFGVLVLLIFIFVSYFVLPSVLLAFKRK